LEKIPLEINQGNAPDVVSRETLIARHFPEDKRIRAYAEFLKTQGIERGLIGPREADRIWERHILLQEAVKTLAEIEGQTPLQIQVIRGRAQDVKTTADYVTARAVAPLEKLKKISWHLLKVNGSLLAMKGEKAQEEMATVPKSILHELNLEGIELGRIVEIKKGA